LRQKLPVTLPIVTRLVTHGADDKRFRGGNRRQTACPPVPAVAWRPTPSLGGRRHSRPCTDTRLNASQQRLKRLTPTGQQWYSTVPRQLGQAPGQIRRKVDMSKYFIAWLFGVPVFALVVLWLVF
jgi:hypothetical protein